MADHGPVISIKLNPTNAILSVQRSKIQVALSLCLALAQPSYHADPHSANTQPCLTRYQGQVG